MVEARADLQTKKKIVAAAFELIAGRGVRSLTLDGVARQASLSKGGVLYHFGGKHDLIRAMLRHALATCLQSASEEAWQLLVRALLVAEYMSPQELEGSLCLIDQLRDSLGGRKATASRRDECMVSAIGAAFLAELGLGAAGPHPVAGSEERERME